MTTERKPNLIQINPESEMFSNVRGVGTVVVDERGGILVGREKIDKEDHGRASGQLSVPAETLKAFERRQVGNILRASLSEIATDGNISTLRAGLRLVAVESPIQLNGDFLAVAVVYRWVGDEEMPFIPADPDEFNDFQWMNPDDFVADQNARPYTAILVREVQRRGLIDQSLPYQLPELDDFVPSGYRNLREMYPDVKAK